jgi:hypothetical protein
MWRDFDFPVLRVGFKSLYHVRLHLLHWNCDLSVYPRGFRSQYFSLDACAVCWQYSVYVVDQAGATSTKQVSSFSATDGDYVSNRQYLVLGQWTGRYTRKSHDIWSRTRQYESLSLPAHLPCLRCHVSQHLHDARKCVTASAVALSIPTWFIFPAHPTKAKFLSEHDKYLVLERIRLNNTGTQNTRM